MWYKASAPGSLMILGEYAVLEGFPALVCAVDKRIAVTLAPREDHTIHLHSQLGDLQMSISNIQVVKPFEFVSMTLKKYKHYFQQGFSINIHAEFSNTIGFASSATVTVATIAVILAWLGMSCTRKQLLLAARDIIREVQGVGSGADVAAAVYGGIIAYESHDLKVDKFFNSYPLSVIYSGNKVRTPEAIRRVKQNFKGKQKKLIEIFQSIGTCAKQGIQAMTVNNWRELGEMMNAQQFLMEALGVTTPILDTIIETFRAENSILGAKISGSGFGDCVIGLGSFEKHKKIEGTISLPVEITMQGVNCSSEILIADNVL